jgi:hypothetical protein
MHWLSATWKWINNLSTLAWLGSLIPSGIIALIVAYLRSLEGAPTSLIVLAALVAFSLSMIGLLAVSEWRARRNRVDAEGLFQDELRGKRLSNERRRSLPPKLRLQKTLATNFQTRISLI